MNAHNRAKKWTEYSAASKFLKLEGVVDLSNLGPHREHLNVDPDEPIDIRYRNWRFQVTTAHGKDVVPVFRGEQGGGVLPTQVNEIIEEYIKIPIQRKIDNYHGTGVEDITLLIYDFIEPFSLPKLEIQITDYLTSNLKEFLKGAGFKDIYLVFEFPEKERNFRVYPLG